MPLLRRLHSFNRWLMFPARNRHVAISMMLALVLLVLISSPSCAGDWPCLFGPTHDSVSTETSVRWDWANRPPVERWRRSTGEGYSAPAIVAERLILFHRQKDREVVEALVAETGKAIWRFDYATAYVDRYGYNGGPRCTPIIADDRVVTYGAEGKLHCLDFASGRVLWSRALNEEYGVEQGFFGVGASPLLEGNSLVINLGAKRRGAGIVAVDVRTGKDVWQATSDGASYATPYAATIHGQRHLFVFTEAGLVDLEPARGHVRFRIPFRSRLYESVNATSPIVLDDLVFVSATYRTGSLAVQIQPDGSPKELWRSVEAMDSHFSNLVVGDGHVVGFSGRHQEGADLRSVDLRTGVIRWKHEGDWGRGSMLRVGPRLILWGERGHLGWCHWNPSRWSPGETVPGTLLRAPCWTPPALANGKLLLRGETELLCLDISP